MIRTLVIDDEPLALQQLAAYVGKIPYLTLVGECQSALEARDIIAREQIDAIFIDINMPDLNGMDFVRSLAAPPIVVFTTAYSEYAIDGYKAAQRVKRRYDMEMAADLPLPPADAPTEEKPLHDDDTIFLKTEHRVVRVNIADIRYVEGMSEYLKVHLENERPIIMLLSMKKMEERLPSSFVRIHRSYIVNMKKVKEVTKNRIVMDADTYLPIGDIYKESLTSYLADKYLGR